MRRAGRPSAWLTPCASLLVVLAVAQSVRAQPYAVPQAVVAGGGGTSTGGAYALTGTAGQSPATMPVGGAPYDVAAGFWTGVSVALNLAPTATGVTISGTPRVAQTLTGSYTYGDVDGDTQGTSTLRWLRGGSAIGGATTTSYVVALGDVGQTLTFEVTPVAATGASPGTPGTSAGVVIQNSEPTATTVVIGGTPKVGQTLTGSYTYGDVDGDAEGTPAFRWLRNGSVIGGATTTSYVVALGDVEQTLTFEVTPVAATGASPGTSATSAGVGVVAAPPTVTITAPTSAATSTETRPFLRLGGTVVSGDARGEGTPQAGTVATVSWTSDRGPSGTATGVASWEAEVPLSAGTNVLTVTATDAVGEVGTDTLTVTVPSFIYYLAEGATGPFFDLELALANPNPTDAAATLQYLKEDGSTVDQSLPLAAQSRQTILVDGVAGLEGTAVSTVVTSSAALPLAVERTMTWDTNGYGSHTEKATPGANVTWYFAEGSEQGFFDTYLLLANPQSTANRATVQFLIEGGSPVTKVYDLLPTSRTNVYAQDVEDPPGTKVLADKAFGVVVTFDVPGVAERAMYFGTAPFWNGGHESAGVNAPSTSWFHAEGATGTFFDTFILLSNPNSTAATVTLRFLLDSGATVTRTKTVGANARLTVGVEGEDPLLANAAMATQVTSDLPVVSERAMYWAGYPNWYEAHNAFGVTATGTKWALGEGRVGGTSGYETYILLANPGAAPATVTVTFLREGGRAPIVQGYTVPATSRYNVYANTVPGLTDGERFGALIESTVPIAVERAMYSNAASQPGVVWAAGTNAMATPIP